MGIEPTTLPWQGNVLPLALHLRINAALFLIQGYHPFWLLASPLYCFTLIRRSSQFADTITIKTLDLRHASKPYNIKERVKRIELSSVPWQGTVIPLYHTRLLLAGQVRFELTSYKLTACRFTINTTDPICKSVGVEPLMTYVSSTFP